MILASQASLRAAETDADAARTQEIARAAMTILRDRCLSCHNEAKHKGDLVMTTRENLMKGGGEGQVVVPGDPDASRMFLSLHAEAEVHMPPSDQLTDAEILNLREWIAASLPWDDAAIRLEAAPAMAPLSDLPASYHPVLALALAPDGTRLAAARGSALLLFSVVGETPHLIGTLSAHTDAIQSLAWSADGTRLASGSFRRIAIHDASTTPTLPIELAVLSDSLEGRVSALVFSPDAQTLNSADGPTPGKGSVRAWNLTDKTITANWIAHDEAIGAMVLDAEGKRIFTAGTDGLVKMWATADQTLERKFEGHTGHVLGLALKAGGVEVEGGRRLASASSDRQVKVWDIETGEQKISIVGHPLGITALVWGADFPQLVSGCEDGVVRLLNEAKEGPEKALPATPDVVYCVAATRDGGRVFAGSHDGLIYCWDKDGKQLAALGPETPSASVAPATETAAAANAAPEAAQ